MTEPTQINRFAVTLIPTEAFLEWINSCPNGKGMTVAEMQRDPTVYLIPEGRSEPETYVRRYYKSMFEEELNSWYTDPGIWPRDRSFKAFKEFFTIHVSSMVYDLGSEAIVRED